MGDLNYTVELALDAHCDLGESPIWDSRTQTVYFVDINARRIHAYTPADGSHATLELAEMVGTVALTSDPDHLLAATERTILLVKFRGEGRGVVRTLATTPESHGVADMRFNDGKVTPQGTLLVGRMHFGWRKGQRGRLYRLDPGATELEEVMLPEEVHLPNGMAWSADGRICYFVDSGTETITAYAADEQGVPQRGAGGKLRGRLVCDLASEHKYVPDGMAIDGEGRLWVVPGESGCVVCYDAASGAEVRRVRLPVQRPTACAFGGDDLLELFVTTRVEGGAGASQHHGGLLRVRGAGVRGAAAAHAYPL